jgi:pSer/pThr/pTyr-binding forkhead associated (FHA) protein
VSSSARDSSILQSDRSRLYDPDLAAPDQICLYDDPALRDLKKRARPMLRVVLLRLRSRVKEAADERSASLRTTTGVSREVAEEALDDGVTAQELQDVLLFDASGIGQLMCVGVGRYPHNALRPYVGDDPDVFYFSPESLDRRSVCRQVSRDHGLIFLDEHVNVYYRDFGTRRRGRRRGSKNGTWINGSDRIRDLVVPWREGDYLGIGGRIWVRRGGTLAKEHVFQLRYGRMG